jgi:hypothetical protein
MKKLLFALALTLIGGASLSTAPSANAAPAAFGIAQAADLKGGIQLAGYHHHGYWYWKRHHRYYRNDFEVFGDGFRHFPSGYYKGYCYDHPYHWWCRKHFHRGY